MLGGTKRRRLRAPLAKIVVSEVTFDNKRISHGGCYQKNSCAKGLSNSGGNLAINRRKPWDRYCPLRNCSVWWLRRLAPHISIRRFKASDSLVRFLQSVGRGITVAPSAILLRTTWPIGAFIKQRQSRIWTREPLKSHPNPAPLSACGHPPAAAGWPQARVVPRRAMTTRLASVWTLAHGPPTRQCAGRIRTQAPIEPAVRPRPWWRPASPRAGAHGLSSGVATMLAHPEEQGSPSCKANVRSGGSTSRPKLMKFNDRLGSLWRDLHSDPLPSLAESMFQRQVAEEEQSLCVSRLKFRRCCRHGAPRRTPSFLEIQAWTGCFFPLCVVTN